MQGNQKRLLVWSVICGSSEPMICKLSLRIMVQTALQSLRSMFVMEGAVSNLCCIQLPVTYTIMLRWCQKLYTDKNALVTPSNQCFIVVTAAMFQPTQPAEGCSSEIQRGPQQKVLSGPIKSAERPVIGPKSAVCRPLLQTLLIFRKHIDQ